jgi:response regulator RpfG family c-di-GMP phosphodiesterase
MNRRHPVHATADTVERILTKVPRGGFDERLRYLAGLEAVDRSEVSSHASGVADTSRDIAKALAMTPDEVTEIREGARWHDLGKLATPDAVLKKPGKLTPDEGAVMREHTEAGVRLLGTDAPQHMLDIAHYHHERYDGHGYHGLKGEEIPLAARIVNVADVHDALIQKREYKSPMPEEDALMLMSGEAKAPGLGRVAFDPIILRTFVAMRLSDPTFRASDENRATLQAFAASDPMADLGGDWKGNDGWHLKKSGHRIRYEEPFIGGAKRMVEMLDPAGREIVSHYSKHEMDAPSHRM